MIVGLIACVLGCSAPQGAQASDPTPPAVDATPTPAVPPAVADPVPLSKGVGSATAAEELRAWVEAVRSGDPTRIASRVAGPVVFRAKMVEDRPPEQTLDQAALLAALSADQGRLMGLAPHHLHPRPEDLFPVGNGTYRAAHANCPAVTWTFGQREGRWFLTEVDFTLLDC